MVAEGKYADQVFISHASEDKPFVKNLTDTLLRYNVRAWYDDYELELGKGIRSQIIEGLKGSTFGVVVLSPNFFAKRWPKRELAALSELLEEGNLLPVFLDMTPAQVFAEDPLLGDIKGIVAAAGDIRNTVVPIAKRVLGASGRPGSRGSGGPFGPNVYRQEVIKISDMPLTADQTLEDIVFDNCLIQGITVLTLHEGIVFENTILNSPEVFISVPEGKMLVGTIGLRRVTFRECSFKDIGFTVSPEQWAALGVRTDPDVRAKLKTRDDLPPLLR